MTTSFRHPEAAEARRLGSQVFVGVHDAYTVEGPIRWSGPGPETKVIFGVGKPTDWYAPFAHPELPSELAKIRNADDEGVLAFVRMYGQMGFRGWFDIEALEGWGSGGPIRYGGDPLSWLRYHANGLHICLEITKALSAKRLNEQRLDDLLSSFDDSAFGDGNDASLVERYAYEGKGGIEEEARWLRRRIMNPNLRGVSRQVSVERETGKDRSFFEFASVVSVAYWHVANAIDGGVLKRCEASGCGGLFIQTDPRQRFCPKQWRQRESACAMRERQRRHRG